MPIYCILPKRCVVKEIFISEWRIGDVHCKELLESDELASFLEEKNMNFADERIARAIRENNATGSTEDVPACFSFGIVFFINAAIWRNNTMEFFNQAITVLQTLVVAIGAGLGVWGVVNLMEGYGNDNPGAKSQGMKQFMAN